MNEMMKPVAWMYVPSDTWRDTVVTNNPEKAQIARDFGREVTPLYTAAQLQEAARMAMERAAKVCDERRATARKRADSGFGDREIELTATLEASCCADAIRALADVAGEKGVGNGEG